MKLFKQLSVGIIIIFFINTFSGNTKQYNLVIYGLFIALLGYKLIYNLYQLYKFKRSTVSKGTVTNYSKEGNIETVSQDYIIDVSFISPHDSKQYTIKSKVNSLPKSNQVDVILNEKNPEKSKVYTQISVAENISLLVAILAFFYFLFTKTFNL